jgi:hypothetical protein
LKRVVEILLAHSPLPGVVQFVIIVGASHVVLLISHEWRVRYTLIGAMLNGRKARLPRAVPENSRDSSSTTEPDHASFNYRAG